MPGRREERREDRQEERQNFGRGGDADRYQMRQRMMSIGDDFFIENERGEKVYRIDGKALRARKTLIFEDMQGHELCKIQEKMLSVREKMDIEGPDGGTLATVKKAMISPVRERFQVNVSGGEDIEIQGNITDHEYEFEAGGKKIAETSKKWFRMRDSYGVEVAPGQNAVLILAATVAVDMMAH